MKWQHLYKDKKQYQEMEEKEKKNLIEEMLWGVSKTATDMSKFY